VPNLVKTLLEHKSANFVWKSFRLNRASVTESQETEANSSLDRTRAQHKITRMETRETETTVGSNNSNNRNTAYVECKNKGDTSNNRGG